MRFIEVTLAGHETPRTVNADHIVMIRPGPSGNAEIVLSNGKDLGLREMYAELSDTLRSLAVVPPF